jgi:hypothetical protein
MPNFSSPASTQTDLSKFLTYFLQENLEFLLKKDQNFFFRLGAGELKFGMKCVAN